MRVTTRNLLSLSLLTLTAALPDHLAKLQAISTTTTTTVPTGSPNSSAPINPTATIPTTSITTIPPTDTATITLTPNPSLTVTEEEEDCTTTATSDTWADSTEWADYDDWVDAPNTSWTAPAPTYVCPGKEICHPGEGEAPPPAAPTGQDGKPVAPYTGGADVVGRGVGALVVLAVMGAWVL